MKKVTIIAEAGVNHNGDRNLAKDMIDVAAEAGCDIVKFQTFRSEDVASRYAPKALYQETRTEKNESQLDMLRKLELTMDDHVFLVDHCTKRKVEFLSTPFDLMSVELLSKLGMQTFKLPSCDLTHLPYLKKIGELNKKIILSTGMATLGEIENALEILVDAGTSRENISLLHCHSNYPTKMHEVNLLAMQTMQHAFKLQVGFSDHTEGVEVAIAAVALGASIIEKHFTLDKDMQGPDHKASLNPSELQAMVRYIRNIEQAMGDGIKKPTTIELENRKTMRKSVHFMRDLEKGVVISEKDLIMKRPGGGVSPMLMDLVIGRELTCHVSQDMQFCWRQVK